jgi:rare lipoprotein A (peptidoglycan hydrolase)
MRHLKQTMLLAAVPALLAAPAAAKEQRAKHRERVRSHISLHVGKHNVLAGRSVVVHGTVRPRGGRRVKVVVRGPRGGQVRVRTDRADAVHDRRARSSASPTRRVTAYRLAGASYYGPGLYGNGMACGGTLLPGTLGVAHKTLPCGSRVRLRYRGRSVTVRVVDRGPYVAGRDFDLTTATKDRLRFPGVGTILASR